MADTRQALGAMIAGQQDVEDLESVWRAAVSAGLPDATFRQHARDLFAEAVDAALDDNLLTKEETANLDAFSEQWGMNVEGLQESDLGDAYSRYVDACHLAGALEHPHAFVDLQRKLGFPFETSGPEVPISHHSPVAYYKAVKQRQFVGASQGVSLRLAKGVTYRFGQFKGHPVETQTFQKVDIGTLWITSRAICFAGATRFRIPLDKIMSIEPASDGVRIWRQAETAKPEAFSGYTGLGWTISTVLANRELIEAEASKPR